ncbi:MAG TPA: fused MFS/spermidine synthase, partial [Candidatus Polarisedimenticolaceae bacterium]|nr:fused MFS/spermidine synthase [Candidatus Polarisedimenticolaceae bacterium]
MIWVFLLFFLSGACGLVYEVVWARMLVPVFGTSVQAVATVLAAFMAGLGLGAWSLGRLADRTANALRLYAALELGIGLFALAFPLLLSRLDGVYTLLYRALGGHPGAFVVARFALGFLLLLVPTTLMGATLPVLGRAVVGELGRVGRRLGALYAVNTWGAALGCFAAAFLLMERIGVRGTGWAAAGLNLFVAGGAFLLSRRRPPRVTAAPSRGAVAAGDPVRRAVFWGFALSGFAALGYEVVWTRLLSVALRLTTAQSLSTMLVAFLIGLAAGGAYGARRVDRWRDPASAFGLGQLVLGWLGIVSLALFAAVPAALAALSGLSSWWGYIVKLLLVGLGVMLAPTFLFGLMFPLASRLQVRRLDAVGERVGSLWAANTAGAIAGALAGGFVLIPGLGTEGALRVLAAVNLAVGLGVLVATGKRGRALALGVPLALLLAFLPAGIVPRLVERTQPGMTLLHWSEGAAGTVTVYRAADGTRLLRVNGAGEVPTDPASLRTFRLLGSLPLLLHPRPEQVLVIAFGGGITLAAAEALEPGHVDCVEVVPEVLDAAPLFAEWNGRIYERIGTPRLTAIFDDGRNHVLRTERRYDVILSDATHPGTADSWVLYTREFYARCRDRLEPGGTIAQWLPLHGLTAEDFKGILRTWSGVFPHASLWLTTDYAVLLGTSQPLEVDLPRLRERLA